MLLTNGVLSAFAGQIKHQIEMLCLNPAASDKNLHDVWFYGAGVTADGAAIGPDLAPTENTATDTGQLPIHSRQAGCPIGLITG